MALRLLRNVDNNVNIVILASPVKVAKLVTERDLTWGGEHTV